MYESTKKNMTDLLAFHEKQQQQNLAFDLTGIMVADSDDNLKKLINQQGRNFKALTKAMSKINIDFITEKWEFEEHLATLKSKWDLIDKIHWELEDELKVSTMKEQYNKNYECMEQKYDSLKREINSKIWSNIHYQQSTPRVNIPEMLETMFTGLPLKTYFWNPYTTTPVCRNRKKCNYSKQNLKGKRNASFNICP